MQKGEPTGVVKVPTVDASEMLLRRCEGPGRGDCLTVVGGGSEISTEGIVDVAQG